MGYLKNTAYIFIPFIFRSQADFAPLVDALDSSGSWTQVHDEIMYMLKYVADKINSRDRKNCQCFHYELSPEARTSLGLGTEDTWFTTESHTFRSSAVRFRFKILSVQMYCFSTSVCMMAFRVYFADSDPLAVSSAQYCLKKVSREKIRFDTPDAAPFTMLSLSEELMRSFSHVSSFQFFYYANPSTERANVLTFLEVEPKDDYQYELFYLRRCYSEGYLYSESEALESSEIYSPSQDITWGISPEAAVCLACPARGRGEFIVNTFYKNFNAQYLFMYVLLLHQKYVLYMFLTKIGIGTYNDLETLEEYRHQLYEFETDFVFSCVTEVPQYQNLYDRMTQAFSLKNMYEDVHEPLMSLGEVRRAATEDVQKKRDASVNRALFILSLLSFFSALIDSFDFIESFFGWFLGGVGVRILQVVCIGLIVVMGISVLKSLLSSKE